MLFARYGNFSGGIDLADDKQATVGAAIRPCRRPSRLLVPLALEGLAPAEPIVQPGQRVDAGDRLAAARDPHALDLHAPLGGKVVGISRASVMGAAGFLAVPAVELTDLSDPPVLSAPKETFDHRAASPEQLTERLEAAGVLIHRRWPRPLGKWVRSGRQYRCTRMILNAMEGQPLVTADHRVLAEFGPQVIAGLTLLARAAGTRTVMLAVDRRRTGDYKDLVAPARDAGVQLMALSHKYPIGADAILVKVLTRREVPLGSTPMRTGTMVIDAATCLAAWRALACEGKDARSCGRVVTVAGAAAADPGNFHVPFGTPCRELTAPSDGPAGGTAAPAFRIHGGPMTGSRCPDDAVVTPATDAVLAVRPPHHRRSTPCIRCGWCTDNCPARLNVSALNDNFELGQLDEARRGGVIACVECGICSYVCPARLPLSQRTRGLKQALAAGGLRS